MPVEGVERGEDLQHREAAGCERSGGNRVAEIVALVGSLLDGVVVVEILFRDDAAVRFELLGYFSSDRTTIKRFNRTTLGECLQHVGQLWITERIAFL